MNLKTKRHSVLFTVPLFFSLIVSSVMFCSSSVCAAEQVNANSSYAEALVLKAAGMKLHDERYWHVLLHYTKTFSGYKSQIDDRKFFLAPDGNVNPEAELAATISAFFNPAPNEKEHAVCRYIARFSWLKEKLAIDESRLPFKSCTPFYDIINKEKPKNVTVVYPAGFINSPASMYGHTFLIVGLDGKDRLVSGAVNYLAYPDGDAGIVYAFKGLFGFFPGYFSMLPYYEKVSEYSDFEKRDIWEYTLDLTEEETIRMLMHVSELDGIYSDYYFLDENCSYNLLWLLEAARPSLHLIDNMGIFVTPIDTIREIGKNNVIKKISYRPSKGEKIAFLASKLNGKERSLALDIASRKTSPDDVLSSTKELSRKAVILDLAAEHLQMRRNKNKVSVSEYSKALFPILKARSSLGNSPLSDEIPVPDYPENSHKSYRAFFGGGWNSAGFFQQVSFRPTYHSLIDRSEGYSFGEEIVFGELNARFYDKEKKPVFQSFDAISLVSIAASNEFFFNWTWKLRTGLTQQRLHDGKDHLVSYLNGGSGAATDLFILGRLYCFAEAEMYSSPEVDRYLTAGAGGTIGLLNKITPWWTTHLYVRSLYYPVTERHFYLKGCFEQSLYFSTNTAITASVSVIEQYGRRSDEASVSFNLFF